MQERDVCRLLSEGWQPIAQWKDLSGRRRKVFFFAFLDRKAAGFGRQEKPNSQRTYLMAVENNSPAATAPGGTVYGRFIRERGTQRLVLLAAAIALIVYAYNTFHVHQMNQ